MGEVVCIFGALDDSELQSFDTSESHVAIKDTGVGSEGVGSEVHFLSVFLVFEDEGTHDDIRVSVDILGDAVVSDVGSKQKRRADVGRAEGVVSNDLNFGINSLDFFADDLNVDHFKGRVGGTFNPDHLSVLFQGLDDVVSISDVHEVSLHALIFSQESPHVSLSSSINIVANDDVVPASEGMKESSCGSASAAESDGRCAIFE